MRRQIGSVVGPVIIATLLAAVGAAPAAAQNSKWGANYFPNTTLTTQDGKVIHFYDDMIKGKIVAIDLIYTTCKYACPLETARMAQVQKVLADRMGKDIFFISITIDPEHDTPEVLKQYAEKFHAGPGWTFLTGKAEDIEMLSKKLGLYSEPDPSDPDGHTPSVLIGNEVTGQWQRNSALDNSKFIANTLANVMSSWQKPRAAGNSYANAPTVNLDMGAYTFKNHCAACHTIGKGDAIGPDLAGVTDKRERGWLASVIIAPDKMLEAGDPVLTDLKTKFKQVVMPRLGLGASDANMLITYIAQQTAALKAAAANGDATKAAPKKDK
jgi:protein SCO1/2